MEDFRRFIQKRNIGTADGKRTDKSLDSSKAMANYSGMNNADQNDDIYDALGQRRLEQTLYYEEEDFDNGQLQNVEELDDHNDYMTQAARANQQSSIGQSMSDLNPVNDEQIDQLRKRVRREAAAFTKVSDDFDIKPLARFMLPEETVRENDVAWDWDSLISDIIIHPDVVQLSSSDKEEAEDESKNINSLKLY